MWRSFCARIDIFHGYNYSTREALVNWLMFFALVPFSECEQVIKHIRASVGDDLGDDLGPLSTRRANETLCYMTANDRRESRESREQGVCVQCAILQCANTSRIENSWNIRKHLSLPFTASDIPNISSSDNPPHNHTRIKNYLYFVGLLIMM